MHDAYEATAILKKLPLQIESIASFVPDGGSTANLLLGTKVGHLLLYEIDLKKGDNSSVRLLQSVKNFSKKPIIQIAVVPQYHILICLTGYPDNILSVHDMTKARFPALSVVERTRGCHLFTLHVTEETSQTGVVSVIVRLCVAIKKRLQLYYWKNRDFHVLREDLCLPENPKTLVWSGESIFVGMRGGWKEYLRISLTGESEDLFPVGTDGEAKIVAMGQGKIGLMQDKKLVIIKSDVFMKSDVMKSDGQPILDSVTWTDHPVAIECDGPYLVGVMSTGVEIQTIEPRMIIQTLALACESREKPKLMSNCQLGLVFLASNYDVWALKATPFNDQIGQLLRLKQFELALRLSEFGTYVDGEREKLVQYIETLHAFDLFCKFNFQDAMSIFLVLDIDPSNVIGLFPDLLPAVFQNQLNFPDKVPELRGHSLENGLLALKDYLVEVRNRLKDNRSKFSLKPIAEGSTTIRSKEKLLQIIDTTLVKCFLQTTDALVTPFLRLQDNKCHLEETERALTKFGKLSELVILYKANGQHRKALFLLQKQAKRPESPLAGTERTVSYLQHLGQDHLELLFEFSTWVMLENPEDGLKIFVDDVPEVEQLPRARVMSHIRDKAPELLVPYLEHVIFEWKDESPALHDTLAERYQATVQALQNAVGPAGDRLNECRKKLKKFLEFSTCFTPERVLMRLPAEGFYKERYVF
ncbi:unnamed protein product [Notodromas monacha]|uniref:CNH domain-containing protein n=1 Tax=Notodromas monacha TaxID=399045 RepID=A0A7R9BIF1_9CRUS|nr:unnamed protein product [Notodromas monacha]CAG0914703.1 unnamed protein product [Notodromas monacha]